MHTKSCKYTNKRHCPQCKKNNVYLDFFFEQSFNCQKDPNGPKLISHKFIVSKSSLKLKVWLQCSWNDNYERVLKLHTSADTFWTLHSASNHSTWGRKETQDHAVWTTRSNVHSSQVFWFLESLHPDRLELYQSSAHFMFQVTVWITVTYRTVHMRRQLLSVQVHKQNFLLIP